MNKWQMDGRTLTWPRGGAMAYDDKNKQHFSIHPFGRNERHKAMQRAKHRRLGG